MAITAHVFGLAQQSFANAEIDFDTASVKVLLTDSSYIPNIDTHRYRSSISGEITGIGYSAGGTALPAKSVSYDAASNTLKLSSGNPYWQNATFTARYAVFYIDTGSAATSPLLCYWDLGADVSPASANLILTPHAAGLLTMTAA